MRKKGMQAFGKTLTKQTFKKGLIQTRKGMLLGEGMRIVLAVICIFLLVFLGVKLYSLFVKKTDIEQARETLNQIVTLLRDLGDGEKTNYLIVAPKGWVIISDHNSLCICDYDDVLSNPQDKDKIIYICEKRGFCEDIINFVSDAHVCTEEAPHLPIPYVIIAENCFQLDEENLPLKLYLSKEFGNVYLKIREEVISEKYSEDFLDYGKDKTVKELILEALGKEGEERKKIERKIKENLDNYFQELLEQALADEEEMVLDLETEVEEMGWELTVFEGNDIVLKLGGPPRNEPSDQDIFVEINGYKVKLSFWTQRITYIA